MGGRRGFAQPLASVIHRVSAQRVGMKTKHLSTRAATAGAAAAAGPSTAAQGQGAAADGEWCGVSCLLALHKAVV